MLTMNNANVRSLVVAVLVLLTAGTLAASAEQPTPTPYRVIFNCDGHSVYTNAKGSVDAWIKNLFDPLEGSHVDALFWCDGAGGNTAKYDSEVLELSGERIGQVDPDLRRWIEGGNDPPAVVVREAKLRGLDVFYSFRVNDIHDGHLPSEFPTFKEQHPDWMLGDEFEEFTTALNFALPDVRQLKLRTIEEIFDKYDFDGIELDFMRFPRFFPSFLEYRNAFILTDFLHTVRQRLAEKARQRGRPIRVAIRVDENLTACRLNGFDIATWINEGLLDLLIIGDYAFPSSQDVQAFKALAQGKPVQVYVCVANPHTVIGGISYRQGDASAVLRGLAANYWRAGADGMYTFNWFPGGPDGDDPDVLSYQIPLLREIGDPRQLVSKDKMFPADASEFGPGKQRQHPSRPRFHNWMFTSLPVALFPTWNANSLTVIPVDVADDLSGASARKVRALELWAQLKNLVAGDVIDFQVNGQPLDAMPEPEADGVVKFRLQLDQLKTGSNEVGLRLNQRGANAADDIILTALEIHVDYE